MNKWEESFKKNNPALEENRSFCRNDLGLFIPSRQLSCIIAIIIVMLFAFFMAGYFFGKKYTVEQFSEKARLDSLADQLYVSALGDAADQNIASLADVPYSKANDTLIAQVSEGNYAIAVNNEPSDTSSLASAINGENEDKSNAFYAQLIGFGTEKAANKFSRKLALKNIQTNVKKRISKTAQGRTKYWYQVVTLPYSDKNTLLSLVNKLEKEEMLKGVCISQC